MLGIAMDLRLFAEEVVTDRQGARKRHRARHTKSRRGCFTCKLRRVKCDEGRPVCGACSSRGEPCTFPSITTSSSKTRKETEQSDDEELSPLPTLRKYTSPKQTSHRCLPPSLQPLATNGTIASDTPQPPSHHGDLEMDNLKLIQYFHLHTAKQMTVHPRRSKVWQRVIPDIAVKSHYLTHLLLALGGIHMITHRLKHGEDGVSDTVDLQFIMEHHQRGLRGFLEAVPHISSANAETIYTGSLLLVAFIFASLQVHELNPPMTSVAVTSPSTDGTVDSQQPHIYHTLQFKWLHLIRGASSVIHDQWPTLRASRLRQMVLYMHGDEYWKDIPFHSSLSRLSHCSLRLQKFAHGARQAIAGLKAFMTTRQASTGSSSIPVLPTTSLTHTTALGSALDEQANALDILDAVYSRIISVLQCSVTEHLSVDDSDVQINFEEAAVLSWPALISHSFIASLEAPEKVDLFYSYSLTILAHFYLINTLVDCWYLNGSFEGEISKIHTLVHTLGNAELDMLMLWPMEFV
ncbi:hypothetical protein ETB97_009059 [Aspergillus alliaceus]|uniref:Zn(2)-C6 fungal-type domain-containing protein n=1 Tax=Petromyces alliaceus TaxID=209559 RepID=A0A8H6AB50_PETAA|nr:hypothetical protein ETB97_009059 [Aspergillus burnettii]